MLKINLGNSSCQFPGFVNSAEFFAQQGHHAPEGQQVFSSAELDQFPWPLADNSVSSAKLIYSLELPHGTKTTLDIMSELYRVCADGALIEIRTHSPLFLQSLQFPFQFNLTSERSLRFLDRPNREKMRQDQALQFLIPTKSDGSELDIDIRILKHEINLAPHVVERMQKKEIKTNGELNQILNTDPTAILFHNFFLVVHKSQDHHFALANTADLPSFAVRIQDPKLNRYGTFALRNNGSWDARLDNMFIQILTRMAQHKADYQQQLNFACVGANIGWFPLLATLAADNVHVDCFEPSPACVDILKQNLEINNVADRANVSAVAMSDTAGQSTLYINMSANGSDSLVKESDEEEAVQVECTTLDNHYLGQNSDTWPSLLMMDTHGHENRVFEGARGMFDRGYRPVIISEFNPKLLELRGECTFHHELVEKYEYTPYIINNADNVNSNLFKADVKFLDQAFETMRNDTNKVMINIVFVPSWLNPETFRPVES